MTTFKKAVRTDSRLRMALVGPSGSGKSYTALAIATNLGGNVAVIDTERGSASKYSGSGLFDFDVLELESYAPERYIDGIRAASEAGYGVLVIDSLSHAWSGKDGLLEFVDKEAARMKGGNSFGAWRNATPKHNALVDAILGTGLHVIVTMRAKTEYVQEKDERGKTQIRKVGMQPVQRDGLEYEFDVVGDLDQDNNLIITKSRCPELSGEMFNKAGAGVAKTLKSWLTGGTAPQPVSPQTPVQETPKEPVEKEPVQISPTAAKRLADKLSGLGVTYPNETEFIEQALGLGALEAFAELNTVQAAQVWEHGVSLAAKDAAKPEWQKWADDSGALDYSAAMGREHGIYPGGGGVMMNEWEQLKKTVATSDLGDVTLHELWFDHINDLVTTKRQAA